MPEEKIVVLGITGSISAYKGADIVSKLGQAGFVVDVVLTESATRLVAPLTGIFEGMLAEITQDKVLTVGAGELFLSLTDGVGWQGK
jgi:phosphopantothenoylcysteine synthetase/decarboxylase